MLSRKHYIAIAGAIERASGPSKFPPGKVDYYDAQSIIVSNIVEEISTVLKRDNPRFNPRRFFDACGVEYDC